MFLHALQNSTKCTGYCRVTLLHSLDQHQPIAPQKFPGARLGHDSIGTRSLQATGDGDRVQHAVCVPQTIAPVTYTDTYFEAKQRLVLHTLRPHLLIFSD